MVERGSLSTAATKCKYGDEQRQKADGVWRKGGRSDVDGWRACIREHAASLAVRSTKETESQAIGKTE